MTAILCLLEDPRHQSPYPHNKPKKISTHMGGLAWNFSCIRYLAHEIQGVGSAGFENDKIDCMTGVPHSLELPFAKHGRPRYYLLPA